MTVNRSSISPLFLSHSETVTEKPPAESVTVTKIQNLVTSLVILKYHREAIFGHWLHTVCCDKRSQYVRGHREFISILWPPQFI